MILGAVLAGGRSLRFGSDKALAGFHGHTLLAHAVDMLAGWCEYVVVVGRETAPAPTLPDWPAPGAGPLGGLAAALRHALDGDYAAVLTCGVDSPGLPEDLLDRLSPAPGYLAAQPVIGLWPAQAAGAIEELLFSNRPHSMKAFAGMIGARAVALPRNPDNINTPADLARAEQRHGL
ncbi:MAG: molybdenum cofactor guanylyltransferase [Novosphingobium sp.]|jgi:molybdopterin-guanine dinucleotide biosynthesis protein A|nr:molybdenum cofactor guanylyltransferase [Novosphingobium sp.]